MKFKSIDEFRAAGNIVDKEHQGLLIHPKNMYAKVAISRQKMEDTWGCAEGEPKKGFTMEMMKAAIKQQRDNQIYGRPRWIISSLEQRKEAEEWFRKAGIKKNE